MNCSSGSSAVAKKSSWVERIYYESVFWFVGLEPINFLILFGEANIVEFVFKILAEGFIKLIGDNTAHVV